MNSLAILPADILARPYIKGKTGIEDSAIVEVEYLDGSTTPLGEMFHVGIAAPSVTPMIYEAVWPRYSLNPIAGRTFDVFRVKNLSDDQLFKILCGCKAALGTPYSIIDLLTGWLPNNHQTICTLEVQQIFAKAGIKLDGEPPRPFPNDIVKSACLAYIGRVNA